jgi:hypothetical protein
MGVAWNMEDPTTSRDDITDCPGLGQTVEADGS